MHSSNSFFDCDRMFVPDFIKLDEVVKTTLDKKAEEAQGMLESIASIVSPQV